MLSYAKNTFRNCRIARMSNGEYCLIRDQGLVKGGRGLKCHETLIVFSIRGIAAKFRPAPTATTPTADAMRKDGSVPGRWVARLGRGPAQAKPHPGRRPRLDEKGVIGRSESNVTDFAPYSALDA
jgi:hypothetical protein